MDDIADNSYHVVISNGTNTTAILDGFTVMDGNANGTFPDSGGGGMYNEGGSNPALTNVTFYGNFASTGAGMLNDHSEPILKKVTFDGNISSGGAGGMFNYISSPTLTDVTFQNNSASGEGGGMVNDGGASPSLTNVSFINNSAIYGGGIFNGDFSNPNLTNATFSGNTADIGGGGIYNYASSPSLMNVTMNNNSVSNSNGGGIYNYANSDPTIINTVVWGNIGGEIVNLYDSVPVVSYGVVQGGYAGGTNIITTDPKLGVLGNYGGFTETIPLLAGSSAIDAGNDGVCPATDQRGVTRPFGSHCDIGAYEYASFAKPRIPILLSPSNGTLLDTLQPTVDWKDATSDLDRYQLQVSTNNTFTNLVLDENDITTSDFTFTSDLDPGVRYYWRVRSFNFVNQTKGWSTVWNFKTPLETTASIMPACGSSLLTDRVDFDWDDVAGAEKYQIQISRSTKFTLAYRLLNKTVTTSEYSMPKDLPQNKTLYWRVRAKSSLVKSPWSDVCSFTTGNPPSVPVLRSPTNGALVTTDLPTLKWYKSSLPSGTTFKRYELQVDDNDDFSSPEIKISTTDGVITETFYTPLSSLTSNVKYYWRVRAVNEVGGVEHESGWSKVWWFRTP